MHGSVTWFSVVAAVSLGILVPVVVVGFFPLGTGMADSFILPKNKTSEAALWSALDINTQKMAGRVVKKQNVAVLSSFVQFLASVSRETE